MNVDNVVQLLLVSDAILRQLALCGDQRIMYAREHVLQAAALLGEAELDKFADKWNTTTGEPIADR